MAGGGWEPLQAETGKGHERLLRARWPKEDRSGWIPVGPWVLLHDQTWRKGQEIGPGELQGFQIGLGSWGRPRRRRFEDRDIELCCGKFPQTRGDVQEAVAAGWRLVEQGVQRV